MIHPPFTSATWEALPRGTKLLCGDGTYETFLVWAPEAHRGSQLVSVAETGFVHQRYASGLYTSNGKVGQRDIIGIIQPVTLPEFWLARSADGAVIVHPESNPEWRTAERWDTAYPQNAPHYVEHHPARVVE